MDVFVPKVVEQLREFYGELLSSGGSYASIGAHLEDLARKMWEGVQAGHEFIFQEIANYHKEHLGRSHELLKGMGLNEADCRNAIAHEYGFNSWKEVTGLMLPYDMDFEITVQSMLAGDFEQLQERIAARPVLINQRSRYGHGATLMHYAVSNGVEIWRQQVPSNLPEMVSFLLEKGASLTPKMKVYGGEYTAPELLLSSMHPRNAGIFDELRHIMDT